MLRGCDEAGGADDFFGVFVHGVAELLEGFEDVVERLAFLRGVDQGVGLPNRVRPTTLDQQVRLAKAER